MYQGKVQTGLAGMEEARAIRTEVFIEEQGFTMEFDELDEKAHHIVVFDGNEAVATGRTFPSEEAGVWTIGRLAVRKPWRGKGAGAFALRELEREAKRNGAEAASLLAQLTAQGFYEKNGYTASGERCMDEHCPHVRMRKKMN